MINFEKINEKYNGDSKKYILDYEQTREEDFKQTEIQVRETEAANSRIQKKASRVYEDLQEEIAKEFRKIPEGKEWHEISQLDANKIKNYNDGLKKAIEIIKKYEV